ncbi:bifunctional phosphoribosylaminoimidazolecarboxamide formyltransferase/IMP cyclohydrolase, partial [bacterium]|nr:bifunctional phosphoribosylaminoimidazolecarboxamide formyltransferase/IMP cyclohydrolase [bacterium]
DGRVKTLHPKVHGGLLAVRDDETHRSAMRIHQIPEIDMVVVNLYPFREASQAEGATVESARANIDIGGPCMVRAAAKNYLRVAAVVDPIDYPRVVEILKENDARLTLASRFDLARKAFDHTAEYDAAIADYLSEIQTREMRDCYTRVDEDA